MSRRVLAWVLALGLTASPVQSQSITQLVADSARLVAQVSAMRQADSLKRAESERPSADTLRAGIFVIAAPRSTHAAVRTGAEKATATLRASLGRVADATAASMQFQVRIERLYRPRLIGADHDDAAVLFSRAPDGRGLYSQFISGPDEAERAAQALQAGVTEQIAREMDPAFKTFAGGRLRLEPAEPALWSNLARDMMLWAAVNRRCAAGALDDCEIAMGLRHVEDPLGVWYEATDLPAFFSTMASSQATYISSHSGSAAFSHCVRGRTDECVPLLAFVNQAQIAPPMPQLGNGLLVRTALEMGGEDGLRRLDAVRGKPLATQIEALAGRPLHDVVQTWQQQIAAHRPRSGKPPFLVTLAGVAWVALLGFAATRSAPWRV